MKARITVRDILNSSIFKYSLIGMTFVAILVTGILFEQRFIRMLPLFTSLFIVMLQANAIRYAYIAGGLNALLYAYVYIKVGLYASAASAALISFPIQMLTFLNWRRKAYAHSTRFKRMTWRGRGISLLLFAVIWCASFMILRALGSDYALLDNTSSLVGIAVSILTMLAYIEYVGIWIVSAVLNLFLNIQVTLRDPSYITYTVSSVYSLICVIITSFNVKKLYEQQRSEDGKGDNQ